MNQISRNENRYREIANIASINTGLHVCGVSRDIVGRVLKSMPEPYHCGSLSVAIRSVSSRHVHEVIEVMRALDSHGIIEIDRKILALHDVLSGGLETFFKITEKGKTLLSAL